MSRVVAHVGKEERDHFIIFYQLYAATDDELRQRFQMFDVEEEEYELPSIWHFT
jgi:myosin heavy subunit